MILKFVAHSKRVLDIAARYGWLPAARYTNLRDVRRCERVGFIDVDWKNYSFARHLAAVRATRPIMTVARDIETLSELQRTLDQAYELRQYSEFIVIVPKHPLVLPKLLTASANFFVLGFSVPTKYGCTKIQPEAFKRPVHLLGGRPEVQRQLAERMLVMSVDCNRFTLDAAYGDYFDGERFRPHPSGGYVRCVRDSIKNINKIWSSYSWSRLNVS